MTPEGEKKILVKETLEKQLQLLAERSANASNENIIELTESMVSVAKVLLALDGNQSFYAASTGHPYVVQLPAADLVDLYAARAELLHRRGQCHKNGWRR